MDSRSVQSGNLSKNNLGSATLKSVGGDKSVTSKKGNLLTDSHQKGHQEEETELLSHLDESRLTKIKAEFMKKEDETKEGLLINEFLEIMLTHLEYQENERMKISMRLIDLFKEIDVNGDQHLEW